MDVHRAKLESLKKLQLLNLLSRKNPYLLKAKGLSTPRAFVKGILDSRQQQGLTVRIQTHCQSDASMVAAMENSPKTQKTREIIQNSAGSDFGSLFQVMRSFTLKLSNLLGIRPKSVTPNSWLNMSLVLTHLRNCSENIFAMQTISFYGMRW
jgi:hypothetical protein